MPLVYGAVVADDLSRRCGDLLTGTCDCVDRIVVNAYFLIGQEGAASEVA